MCGCCLLALSTQWIMSPKVSKSRFSLRTPSFKTPINSKVDRCSAQAHAFEFLYCARTVPLSPLVMFVCNQCTRFLLDDKWNSSQCSLSRVWTWTARLFQDLNVKGRKQHVGGLRLRLAGWASMILLPHYLDSLVLSFSLTDVDANGNTLRLAWQPTVSLVGEKNIYIYDFEPSSDGGRKLTSPKRLRFQSFTWSDFFTHVLQKRLLGGLDYLILKSQIHRPCLTSNS
jgi:hypothetical protein